MSWHDIGRPTLALAALPALAGLGLAAASLALPDGAAPLFLAGAGVGVSWLTMVSLLSRQRVLGRLTEGRERTREEMKNLLRQAEMRISLGETLGFDALVPPLRSWAISPDLGWHLVKTILETKPRLVVELGSGASTILIGKALRRVGAGRLVSIEHEAAYAVDTWWFVEQHGLTDLVEVREAPLEPVEVAGRRFSWYRTDSIEDLRDIDLLLIDGPPWLVGKGARLPALPQLGHRLAKGVRVILDDTDHPEMRLAIEAWRAEFPSIRTRDLLCEKGGVEVTFGA
ncbi:MAG: class I SAM-dependent methyltransferase [Planctomycetes bacterium]|nr:class I SAM-dependent methyltransferase [Planctomycetota bacterium]